MLADQDEDYRIGGGDIIEVSIYELEKREEFKTIETRVEEGGEISLPVLGIVRAGGRTVLELEEAVIRKLIDDDFILAPRVNIIIKEYNSKKIAVLGAVAMPGEYPIKQNVTTLWEALSMAGGPTNESGYDLYVHRTRELRPGKAVTPPDFLLQNVELVKIDLYELLETGNPDLNMALKHGDVVHVPKAKQFFVWGFVNSPGGFSMNRPMTVLEGVAMAGGLIPREASPSCTVLKRLHEGGREENIDLDLVAIARGEHPNIYLQPNDVLEVRQSTMRFLTLELVTWVRSIFVVRYNINANRYD
jgi:polysaccharide export outer membrane protein